MKTLPRSFAGWIIGWLGLCLATLGSRATSGQDYLGNPLRSPAPAVSGGASTPSSSLSGPNVASEHSHPRPRLTPVRTDPVKPATYQSAPRGKSSTSVMNETRIFQPSRPGQMPMEMEMEMEMETDELGEPYDMGYEMGLDGCCDMGQQCGTCCDGCSPGLLETFCRGSLSVFGGAHGFTGPCNRGQSGSFGFHYGLNWGGPLPCVPCEGIGMQLGVQAVHSNLSGAEFTTDGRDQLFVTAGFFQRTDCGWQGGAVIDYLSDDWYYQVNLAQVRGELSWVFPTQDELGFWFNSSTTQDDSVITLQNVVGQSVESFEATDIYSFFYRRKFDDCGTEGRFFVGFSGTDDGLIGADFTYPLTPCLTVDSGFAYLIPEEGKGAGGNVGESWNVGVRLVWYPGGSTFCGRGRYRPLLRVAGNDSFFVDRF